MNTSEDSPKNRWVISATLTTLSELHPGSGEEKELADRDCEVSTDFESSRYDAVFRDHAENPAIPGSSIKGVLRNYLEKAGSMTDDSWLELMGHAELGGKLEFHDAYFRSYQGSEKHPWWKSDLGTGVATSVAIERTTATAAEEMLYSLEFVPVGTDFTLEITGANLTEEEVARAVALLEAFNRDEKHAPTLGAGRSLGWGKVKVAVSEVRTLSADQFLAMELPADKSGYELCQATDVPQLAVEIPSPEDQLLLKLHLRFDTDWLVNDPQQRERSAVAKEKSPKKGAKQIPPPDAAPVLDEFGRPFLPAKSLRGALRSQAEKILRTVGLPAAGPGDQPDLSGESPSSAQKIISNLTETQDLAMILFGTTNWLSPLTVSRFVAAEGESINMLRNEFVAIDRFTGGAADKFKFSAQVASPADLQGTLTIDLARLAKADPSLASLGLLALTLRDLVDGDIGIGLGARQGRGRCSAVFAEIRHHSNLYSDFNSWSEKVVPSFFEYQTNINPPMPVTT